MNTPTRRHVLILAMTGTIGALSACGGDTKSAEPSPGTSRSSGNSTAAAAPITPVDGFSAQPSWSSATVQALAGLAPLPGAGAAWFGARAWFLVAKSGGADRVRVVALDPATKQVALSSDIPAQSNDLDEGQNGPLWWTITTPTPALLLRVGVDLLHLDVAGDTITTTRMPTNPVSDGSNTQPQWIGDAIVAVSQNKTYAATGDPADATNKLTPSYYLDPTKKTWVAMAPKHDGTIIGVSANGGSVTPVELAKSKNGGAAELWVGARRMTSGLTHPGGNTYAAGEYPITSLAWSHDGSLLLGIGDINSPTKLVAYGPDGKPRTGTDSTKGTWNTPGSQYVRLSNQMVYNTSNGQTRLGGHSDSGSQQWDLSNMTLGLDGTLYANADPQPEDTSLPTSGAYVNPAGVLDPAKHTDKVAPSLVLPDGSGLFLSGAAQILSRG